MLLRRSAISLSRRAAAHSVASRTFATSVIRRDQKSGDPAPGQAESKMVPFEEVKGEEDLLPPGAQPGTVPTDLDQSTGLERLEILGKMQGIDIFDMKPLDASRLGTLADPIMVKSFGDEQYCGCTGFPADSHVTKWLTISRGRPIERCPECGSVYKMEYVGPPDDPHAHEHHDGHHNYEEPKTFADYVKEDYRWT
ncbi:cytochrome c oxidase subunit 4 [Physcia stellaris]|nr:cytochrome c oxidase subunit 4 [Physcia stellaris]